MFYASPVSEPLTQRLVNQSIEGDHRAQRELYKRYSKSMFHVAFRICHDEMEAEDILQESFLKAFRKMESFKGESTFGAWLKRIVINTAINHCRKKRDLAVDMTEEIPELAEETPRDYTLPIDMADIHSAIHRLPEGYRRVFSLYLLEGYDHAEIGEILHISEATSKSQFCRARKKLVQMLQGAHAGLPMMAIAS